MLVNPDEDGDVYFKVLPTTKYEDRETYKKIILKQKTSATESNISNAYNYMYKDLSQKIANS